MSPTFILGREDGLTAALGSAGGERIISDVLQVIIGMLDWKLAAAAALDLPRVANTSGLTELETRGSLPQKAPALRRLGHKVQVGPHGGGLTVIRREAGGWEGAVDPRRARIAEER